MRTIRAAISAVFDAFAAALELWATEARAGVTLVEAVAIAERLTELRAIGDPAELLDTAIIAAKAGLLADDIEPMAAVYYTARMRGITDSDIRDMGNIIRRHVIAPRGNK